MCQPHLPQQWSNLRYTGRICVIYRYILEYTGVFGLCESHESKLMQKLQCYKHLMSQPILDFKIEENRWEYLEQSTQNWKMVKQDEVAITKEQCKTKYNPTDVCCLPPSMITYFIL